MTPSPWRCARENNISVCVTSEALELSVDGAGDRVTVRWSPDTDRTHAVIWLGLARCLLQRRQGVHSDEQAAKLAAELRGEA